MDSNPTLSRKRRVIRAVAIFGGGLCLIVVLLLLVLQSAPVQKLALDRITAALAARHIDLHADALQYNLFTLSIDVRNLRVRSADAPDLPAFATIGHAQVDLSLTQLLRGRYVLQSGLLDGADVQYVVDTDGRDNLPRPPAGSSASRQSLDYFINRLSISNARVRYLNRAQHMELALPVSTIEVMGNTLTDRHQLRFESTHGDVQIKNYADSIDRVSGVLDLGRDDVSIDRLRLEGMGARADLAGVLRAFDAPRLQMTLRARVDAARVAAFLLIRDRVTGIVDVDAKASGLLSAPIVDAHLSSPDLQVRSLAGAEVEARARYDSTARRAHLSSARIQAPWGRLVANGDLAAGGESVSRLHAELLGVDAAAILRGLNLSPIVGTRLDGKLDAEWPGLDYVTATGTAAVSFTPTSTPPKIVTVAGRLSARGGKGAVIVDAQAVTVAGTQLDGGARIGIDHRLEGHLRVSAPDLASPLRAAESLLGRAPGPLLPASVRGPATVDARLSGTLEKPAISMTLSAPSLSVGRASGIDIGADLTVTPAAMTITRAEARWSGTQAGVIGTVGLTGPQQLDLALAANAPDLQTLIRATQWKELTASGRVTATGTIRGAIAKPFASVTVQGTDITAFGERVGSLTADATLLGPDLTLSRLVIDKPQADVPGQITATGSYNLDRGRYTFDLQSKNVRLLEFRMPNGQRIRGPVEISGRGAGSVNSPSGSLGLTFNSLEIESLQTRSADPNAPARLPAQLGRIVIEASAGNHQATIKTSAEQFGLTADALVGLAPPWPSTLTARADDLDLERLLLGANMPLDGRLRGTVHATGDLAEPRRARATASIEALTGSWNGQPFRVTSPREWRYENQRLSVERLEFATPDSSLVISGDLPLTADAGTGGLVVEAHASLATLARLLPSEMSVKGDGAATLTGSVRGTLKSISPDLTLTVENGVLSSPQLGADVSNIQLRARVADGAADIERLTSRWGNATIDASGSVPLEVLPRLPVEIPRKGGRAIFKASVRDLDPAAIPGVPPGVTGRVDADLAASADRADLAALNGHVEFPQLEIAFNRLTLAQQDTSRVSIDAGRATVERLALSGSAGALVARGTVGLLGERPVDLNVDGRLEVATLSALTKRIRTDGTATWKIAALGTLTKPELNGTFDLTDATVASDDLNIAAVDVNAHVNLSGSRVELTKLTGEVNGGALDGSGGVTLGNGTIGDIDLRLSANDVAYDAPLDLRSLSDAAIRVNRRGEEFIVGGDVTIKEAGLTTDINLNEGLFAAIGAPRTLDLTEARDPLLERVRFNIGIKTAAPVTIDNNLARAEIDADLRIVGTPYEPGLTGRMTLAAGGQVTLNARRYEVERGVITFVDDRRIVPSVDLALNTKASNYDVRIAVAGTPGKTEASWTSEPPLPEPDIMALLVTGRTVDEMRGEESEVARVQALSYLTGRVGSRFGRGLERATGISEVRIEPVLIANETDPTARLTVGQNVTDQVKLIYSTNLADSNDQIWVAEYDVTRRFQMRGVRERDDDSYRVDFRHDLRFGGDPAPRRQLRHRPTIASLAVVPDAGLDEGGLRKLFKLKVGDSYEYFAARSGLERIEQHYFEAGYLQSRVRLDRNIANDQANLTLRVTSGPIIELRFEGSTPPSKVQRQIRSAWHQGVFDKQRGNDSIRVLRDWLIQDNYLQPAIEYSVEDGSERRQVTFRIRQGTHYQKVVLAFEAASGIDSGRLDKIVEQQHMEQQLFTDPSAVTSLLQRYYHEQGYLSAEIDVPRYDFQGTNARVIVPVREGPRFLVRSLTVAGNTLYPSTDVISKLPLVSGGPFISAAAEHGLERIRELYWRKGYNDMRSEYSLGIDRNTSSVDVAFTIVEGRQSVVADIAIEGNRKTSERLVRGQVELLPMQPLDLAVLARSRKNLYGTGAFSIADITRGEAEGEVPASTEVAVQPVAETDTQKPVHLTVSVREVQPVQLRYGLSYDTEGGLGGILDFSVHNSLGNARVLGAQGRYDSEIHEGRIYVSQPSLRTWPRKTTASVYFRQDVNPPTEQTDPFDISRQGASIQQEAQFRKFYVWSYGYRYELATTLEPSLGVGVTETVRVTPLTSTLTRETRDEVLDASKGTFFSQAFAYSPSWLGSDRPYLKYYGQYFYYFPLRPEKPKPFTNEILRARLVFATGVRVGLAHGLGGDVPTSERFYAGGSTTLRGFEQNAVGPIGVNNVPAGGNASVVLNNELRMPVVRIIDGVLFLDVGNVYPSIKDFSFGDLRESGGVGIRLRTPWVLLRTDYGWVLDPRPGEKRGRFYFSIGQAF